MHVSADINDCEADSCANGGTCIDGVDSFSCECAAGFAGPNCNTSKDLSFIQVAFCVFLLKL